MNSHSSEMGLHQRLAVLKDREFQQFSAFVYDEVGIKLPPTKKTMLEARLQKRLKALGMNSFEQYAAYLFSPQGRANELVQMINVVTTNKTDFFREPAHFDFLVKTAIPVLRDLRGERTTIRFWSAGCSTGEEPYTLMMVLSEYANNNPGFRFSVMASDIDTQVIEKAKSGIYAEDRVDTIPLNLKKKYLLRSRDHAKSLVRIVPELRSQVQFRRINFMDDSFGMAEPLDIIFCRNVIIYFDQQTQERLMHKFYRNLAPGGFLFLGHSETLNGIDTPFQSVAATVYRKL